VAEYEPGGASFMKSVEEATRDLVAFFRSLPADAKRDYEKLADLDREFGEDVVAERRERTKRERS
jgi:hypothetical protein